MTGEDFGPSDGSINGELAGRDTNDWTIGFVDLEHIPDEGSGNLVLIKIGKV
jgi:hypothetical protein